jgi:hypothetical protein
MKRNVRSQDTPPGRMYELQWRKESSVVRILPWGERMGFSGGKKGQGSGYVRGEKRWADFSVEKKGQGSGYAPGEKGWASAEERKVRGKDTSEERKDGLTSV